MNLRFLLQWDFYFMNEEKFIFGNIQKYIKYLV